MNLLLEEIIIRTKPRLVAAEVDGDTAARIARRLPPGAELHLIIEGAPIPAGVRPDVVWVHYDRMPDHVAIVARGGVLVGFNDHGGHWIISNNPDIRPLMVFGEEERPARLN